MSGRIFGKQLTSFQIIIAGFIAVILIGAFGFLFFAALPFANNSLDYLTRTHIPDVVQGRVWGLIGFLSQLGYLMASGINCKIESYDNAMFQSAFGDKNAWDVAICQMGMRDVAFVWGFLSYKYSGGEQGAAGMAVQDEKFDELLGTVMSVDGHTNENATLLSDYINEMAYGEALVNTTSYWIFRKDIGAVAVPRPDTIDHYIACTQFE